jgi:hypothetical protein
MTALAGTA